MIPVGYAPSSVVLDTADNALLVANDKGIGTTGYGVAPSSEEYGRKFVRNRTRRDLLQHPPGPWHGQHRPYSEQRNAGDDTRRKSSRITTGIWRKISGRPLAAARPPSRPSSRQGSATPSKIKHVFVIIRENRTYDQMLGDVKDGNGDPTLAVFGDSSTFAAYPVVSPNAHTMVQRFPLLDNFYDPSRQSADGHNWILQAMAPYSDDIQSPDWLRDYPSNGGDAHCLPEEGPPVRCRRRSRHQDEELRRVRRVQHVHRAGLHSEKSDPRHYI